MGELIRLTDELPCAICPECHCAAWHIEVRSYDVTMDDINAFECCDCGMRIEFVATDDSGTMFELVSEDV